MLLTRTLGYRSIYDLSESMEHDEFLLWEAEYRRSPWDERRADLRAGVIASTIANYAGKTRSKNADAAKPIDFMPYCQPEPEEVEVTFDYLQDIVNGQ